MGIIQHLNLHATTHLKVTKSEAQMPKTLNEGSSKKTVRGMDAEGRAFRDELVACFRLHHSFCRKLAFCLNLIATASSINQTSREYKKQHNLIHPWSLVPATPSMACRSELAELRALARLDTFFTHAVDGLLLILYR